jgi:hypothetical protein
MKTKILKGVVILFITGLISCEKGRDEIKEEKKDEISVDDSFTNNTWASSDGTLVFTGNTNSINFREPKSGRFQEAYQKGLIKVGDPYIRNIVKKGSTWNCDVLFWGLPSGKLTLKWSTEGILSLSADKKTLTISSPSPFDSSPSSGKLYKK